jgi:hypothetical protein
MPNLFMDTIRTIEEKIEEWYSSTRINREWEKDHQGLFEGHFLNRVFLVNKNNEVECRGYLCAQCGLFVDLVLRPGSYEIGTAHCLYGYPINAMLLDANGLVTPNVLHPDYEKWVYSPWKHSVSEHSLREKAQLELEAALQNIHTKPTMV